MKEPSDPLRQTLSSLYIQYPNNLIPDFKWKGRLDFTSENSLIYLGLLKHQDIKRLTALGHPTYNAIHTDPKRKPCTFSKFDQ
jgi:hypothetical protein